MESCGIVLASLVFLAGVAAFVALSVKITAQRRRIDELERGLTILENKLVQAGTAEPPPPLPQEAVSTPPMPEAPEIGREESPSDVAAFEVEAPEDVPPEYVPEPPAELDSRALEELVGTKLFLRAGVAIVVVGVVLFLGLALTKLGAAGKIAVGALTGAAFLAGGLIAERRERYRTFGRALVAGGWGILYFVAFAAHFVPASRVIDSRFWGILLLLAVASAAVGFSLRYRSEWTTTSSFLLIFLALAFAGFELEMGFNLVAAVIVAVALAGLSAGLGWEKLLALGAPATWATLAVALVRHVAGLGPTAEAETAVLASLALTWAALQAVLFIRSEGHDGWQVAAFLSNLAGAFGLAILYLDTTGPDSHWALAVTGAVVYAASAARFRVLGRTVLYRLSGTTALVGLALTFPLYFGWRNVWVPLLWLLLFQSFLVAAIHLRDGLFRALAHFGLALVFFDIAFATELFEDHHATYLVGATILALVDAYLLYRPWRSLIPHDEARAMPGSYAATAAILVSSLYFRELEHFWIAAAFAFTGLVWAWAGRRLRASALLWQSAFLLGLGLLSISVYSWWQPGEIGGWPKRSVSTALALAGLFATHALFDGPGGRLRRLAAAILLSANSAFLMLLVAGDADAFQSVYLIPLLWCALGCLYFEIADLRSSRSWWYLGHVWLLAALIHLHLAAEGLGQASWNIVAAILVVVLAYAAASWRRTAGGPTPIDPLRPIYALLAAATLARLLGEAVSGTLLSVAWSLEGLVAVVLGFALRERILRWIGLGLLSFCIFKLFLYDLSGLEGLARIASFIVLGLVLIFVSWAYTRFRGQLEKLL